MVVGRKEQKSPKPLRVSEATKQGYVDICAGDCVDMSMPSSKTRRGRSMEAKSNCLQTTCEYYQYCGTISAPIYEVNGGMITVKGKQYPIKLVDGFYIIRKLTVRECMRLQTVQEWYKFPVSNSQAYKMLGNGWTVDVISWIINTIMGEIKKEKTETNPVYTVDFVIGFERNLAEKAGAAMNAGADSTKCMEAIKYHTYVLNCMKKLKQMEECRERG